MTQQTSIAKDLVGPLDDLISRVAHVEQGIVLSADGLLVSGSSEMSREEAEQLAATAAGLRSLARGVSRRFGGGSAVRQTVVEMEAGFLFVTAAGKEACLAVLAYGDADVGLIAYEMAMLATRVDEFLSTRRGSAVAAGAGAGAEQRSSTGPFPEINGDRVGPDGDLNLLISAVRVFLGDPLHHALIIPRHAVIVMRPPQTDDAPYPDTSFETMLDGLRAF